MLFRSENFPQRPAWTEIDLGTLRRYLPRIMVKEGAWGFGLSSQKVKLGEVVGYGLHYGAKTDRRLVILPIGYGDVFPRVRNS